MKYIVAAAAFVCAVSVCLATDEDSEISLDIQFEGAKPYVSGIEWSFGRDQIPKDTWKKKQRGALPYAFVNGRLAGLVPGTIAVNFREGPTVIEIGYSELQQQPLFSFEVSHLVLERGLATATITNFSPQPVKTNTGHGYALKVLPNLSKKLTIKKLGAAAFSLDIPQTPYDTLDRFARFAGSKIAYEDGIVAAFSKKYETMGEDIPAHWIFSEESQSPITMAYSSESRWTGSAFMARLLPERSTAWQIGSTPDDAVITIVGRRTEYMTVTEMLLTRRMIETLVLRKPDYQDCPYSPDKIRVDEYGKLVFFCALTRVKPR